jgi:hypothetical protein
MNSLNTCKGLEAVKIPQLSRGLSDVFNAFLKSDCMFARFFLFPLITRKARSQSAF